MEDAKYNAGIRRDAYGFVQGDYAHVTMHVHPSVSSPTSPYRSILGGPPLTDPRSIQQRGTLVESIVAQLRQPGLNALVLTGIGGVGKSTLAGLIYQYVQNHLSEGLFMAPPLWLRIDATTTFADIMGSIYQVLEKPLPDLKQLSPASQAQALFFTLSRAPARLIVIDQCEVVLAAKTGKAFSDRAGLAEWFDVINSQPCETGCRLLFTSRQRPRGNHADPPTYLQVSPVGGLTLSEGVELFHLRKVQAIESEIKQAVTLCSGHGLSLTLLLNLVQDYGMPLADLLADVSMWEGDIATNLLDAVFQQLSTLEREMICAFSVYRPPVPIEAAQALLKLEYQKQALAALRMLLNQHLIQFLGDATYQLHIIIARYAQQHFVEKDDQANQRALQQAHGKAASYYREVSARHAPLPEQRRSLKEVEPLLEAIWHLTQAGEWQEGYQLARDEEVFEMLGRCGGFAQLVEVSQLFLTCSYLQEQPIEMAFLFSWQGNASRALGRSQQTLTCYEKALTLCQEVGDRANEGGTLTNLGGLYNDTGRKVEALRYFEQALAIRQEVGDRAGEGTTFNNLGNLYSDLGQKMEALQYYEQALAIAQEVGNHLGEGSACSNLGSLYNDIGRKVEALRYFEQALAIYLEIGDRPGEGTVLNNLGTLYYGLGEQAEALQYYDRALAIAQEIGDRVGKGATLNSLGMLYRDLGKQKEALHHYEQALAILQEVGDREKEGLTFWNMGAIFFELKKYATALAALLLAERLFQQILSPNLKDVENWIIKLELRIGEEQFRKLFSQVSPRPEHILRQALFEWKRQSEN